MKRKANPFIIRTWDELYRWEICVEYHLYSSYIRCRNGGFMFKTVKPVTVKAVMVWIFRNEETKTGRSLPTASGCSIIHRWACSCRLASVLNTQQREQVMHVLMRHWVFTLTHSKKRSALLWSCDESYAENAEAWSAVTGYGKLREVYLVVSWSVMKVDRLLTKVICPSLQSAENIVFSQCELKFNG